MSFPSMSIQELVKSSSIIVNPIVTQNFCRRESHEASTGRAFPDLLTRASPFPLRPNSIFALFGG
jgi:hypothetical protein